MILYKTLKNDAKLALRGNWGRAIVVTSIFAVLVLILTGLQQYAADILVGSLAYPGVAFNDIPYLVMETETLLLFAFAMLTILLVFPMEMGMLRWFYRLVHSEDPSVGEAFTFFDGIRKYIKSIGLYINITVRAILWAVPFYTIPSVVMWLSIQLVNGRLFLIGGNPRANASFGTMGMILSLLLFTLSTLLFVIFMNRYTLAIYFYFDDMETSVITAIKNSVKYSKGYRLSLFRFQLSFIGWLLLCLLIFPALYLIPYYNTSMSIFARYIIEKKCSTVPVYASTSEQATMEFHAPTLDSGSGADGLE